MSHTELFHTQRGRGPVSSDVEHWYVREEGAGYDALPFSERFVQYSDMIDNRLPKARALAWLLHEGALTDEQAIREAALAVVDTLDEVAIAHEKLYAQYVGYRDGGR